MRLLPTGMVTVDGERNELILQDRAELFVRCGVSLTEFQTLTTQEIEAIIRARETVLLEHAAILRQALGPYGDAAIEAMQYGADSGLRVAMEAAADKAVAN